MYSKRELRKRVLSVRSKMTEQEVSDKSKIIVSKVKELLGDETIGLFHPIKNEDDLLSLVSFDTAFPRVIDDMAFYKYTGSFVIGNFDIPEPTGELTEIQTVIVPGSVFDLLGFRIGYGGGYYDKYLKPHHLKIGVCFDFQVIEKLPIESHDVQLDMLITEKRIIQFKE